MVWLRKSQEKKGEFDKEFGEDIYNDVKGRNDKDTCKDLTLTFENIKKCQSKKGFYCILVFFLCILVYSSLSFQSNSNSYDYSVSSSSSSSSSSSFSSSSPSISSINSFPSISLRHSIYQESIDHYPGEKKKEKEKEKEKETEKETNGERQGTTIEDQKKKKMMMKMKRKTNTTKEQTEKEKSILLPSLLERQVKKDFTKTPTTATTTRPRATSTEDLIDQFKKEKEKEEKEKKGEKEEKEEKELEIVVETGEEEENEKGKKVNGNQENDTSEFRAGWIKMKTQTRQQQQQQQLTRQKQQITCSVNMNMNTNTKESENNDNDDNGNHNNSNNNNNKKITKTYQNGIIYHHEWTFEEKAWRSPYAQLTGKKSADSYNNDNTFNERRNMKTEEQSDHDKIAKKVTDIVIKDNQNQEKKQYFVTFEADSGGFNNIRMAFEIVVVFALLTGRILVLPDEYYMYLLSDSNFEHDFSDFFDLDHVGEVGLQTIQTKDFLHEYGLAGKLGPLPPGNRTVFPHGTKRELTKYLRQISHNLHYPPESYVLAFDEDVNKEDFERMRKGRKKWYYEGELANEPILHFTAGTDGGTRYLSHFYAAIYIGNMDTRRRVFRFVRDYLHYKDEIFCAAYDIIEELHQEKGSTYNNNFMYDTDSSNNRDFSLYLPQQEQREQQFVKEKVERNENVGGYAAIHIRRGDFQFKQTRLPISTIFANVADLLYPGQLLYILTDEKNHTLFEEANQQGNYHYNLKYLRDFNDHVDFLATSQGDPNIAGMVEQLIATGADIFIGTPASTFTSYITRLRGYRGVEQSYYFLPEWKSRLVDKSDYYAGGRAAHFEREWRVAFDFENGSPAI